MDKDKTAMAEKMVTADGKPAFDTSDHSRAEMLGGKGDMNAMEAAARHIEEARQGDFSGLKNPLPEGEPGSGFVDASWETPVPHRIGNSAIRRLFFLSLKF